MEKKMKNWAIILIIFLVPVVLYFVFSSNKEANMSVAKTPTTAVVYKFMSPMCSECIVVQKKLDKIKNNWDNVVFEEINVTENSPNKKRTKELIKKYDITMVPTLVFIDNTGNFYKKIEVDMTEEDIENGLKGIAPKRNK